MFFALSPAISIESQSAIAYCAFEMKPELPGHSPLCRCLGLVDSASGRGWRNRAEALASNAGSRRRVRRSQASP
jgi:hypothetical protein